MLKNRWLKFSSIRCRIIMLCLIGITGMGTIAFFNKYLEVSKLQSAHLGDQSQQIDVGILEIMMSEEKFINTTDNKLLTGIKQSRENLREKILDIEASANHKEINNISKINFKCFPLAND